MNKLYCDRCYQLMPAYYILSHKTKGLWIKCSKCGNHAMKYKSNLNIPAKPSKSYSQQVLLPTGDEIVGVGSQKSPQTTI